MNKKRTKTIIEVIILTIVLIIALWVGAFLLRDKSEFFCKMSFGEYRTTSFSSVPTVGNVLYNKACVGSLIVDIFGN